jgi:hypothetical protein
LLDTREYEIEFPNGSSESYRANLIAENIRSQVDSDGRQFAVIKEIIDHRSSNGAIKKADGYVLKNNGQLTPKRTNLPIGLVWFL